MTTGPSAAWALRRSAGALGHAVACGCSLTPKIDDRSSSCKALLVLRVSNSSSLLGGSGLACTSSEARNREQAGVWECRMWWWVCTRQCGIAQEGGSHGEGDDAGWRSHHCLSRRLRGVGRHRCGSYLPCSCPTTSIRGMVNENWSHAPFLGLMDAPGTAVPVLLGRLGGGGRSKHVSRRSFPSRQVYGVLRLVSRRRCCAHVQCRGAAGAAVRITWGGWA